MNYSLASIIWLTFVTYLIVKTQETCCTSLHSTVKKNMNPEYSKFTNYPIIPLKLLYYCYLELKNSFILIIKELEVFDFCAFLWRLIVWYE